MAKTIEQYIEDFENNDYKKEFELKKANNEFKTKSAYETAKKLADRQDNYIKNKEAIQNLLARKEELKEEYAKLEQEEKENEKTYKAQQDLNKYEKQAKKLEKEIQDLQDQMQKESDPDKKQELSEKCQKKYDKVKNIVAEQHKLVPVIEEAKDIRPKKEVEEEKNEIGKSICKCDAACACLVKGKSLAEIDKMLKTGKFTYKPTPNKENPMKNNKKTEEATKEGEEKKEEEKASEEIDKEPKEGKTLEEADKVSREANEEKGGETTKQEKEEQEQEEVALTEKKENIFKRFFKGLRDKTGKIFNKIKNVFKPEQEAIINEHEDKEELETEETTAEMVKKVMEEKEIEATEKETETVEKTNPFKENIKLSTKWWNNLSEDDKIMAITEYGSKEKWFEKEILKRQEEYKNNKNNAREQDAKNHQDKNKQYENLAKENEGAELEL